MDNGDKPMPLPTIVPADTESDEESHATPRPDTPRPGPVRPKRAAKPVERYEPSVSDLEDDSSLESGWDEGEGDEIASEERSEDDESYDSDFVVDDDVVEMATDASESDDDDDVSESESDEDDSAKKPAKKKSKVVHSDTDDAESSDDEEASDEIRFFLDNAVPEAFAEAAENVYRKLSAIPGDNGLLFRSNTPQRQVLIVNFLAQLEQGVEKKESIEARDKRYIFPCVDAYFAAYRPEEDALVFLGM